MDIVHVERFLLPVLLRYHCCYSHPHKKLINKQYVSSSTSLAAFCLNGQTRSDLVWSVISPAAGEKEQPDQVRLGLASEKELDHWCVVYSVYAATTLVSLFSTFLIVIVIVILMVINGNFNGNGNINANININSNNKCEHALCTVSAGAVFQWGSSADQIV